MYAKGGLGGGDVKLFAALGAALQPMLGLEAMTYTFVVAAVVALGKLVWKGTLFRVVLGALALLFNAFRKRENRAEVPEELMASIPLAPCALVGTLVTMITHTNFIKVVP
jgi:Flp pilus assembly protein protease CpaA